jgi:hypothetical protein
VLRHVADARAHADAVGCIEAEHPGRAGRRLQETEEDLDDRALARAVLAEDAGDAIRDGEADVIEGENVLVLLGEMFDGEERFPGGRSHVVAFGLGHASR